MDNVGLGCDLSQIVGSGIAKLFVVVPFLFDNMVETGLLAIDGPSKLDADPKADLDTKNKADAIEVRLKLAG